MGEEEKKAPEEVRVCLRIPTKEGVIKKIKEMFPTVTVEEEEKPAEKPPTE